MSIDAPSRPSERAASMPITSVAAYAVEGTYAHARIEPIVVEAPLEIRVLVAGDAALQGAERTISVTMRTPGVSPTEDQELALGFLFSEGVLCDPADIAEIAHRPDAEGVILVRLRASAKTAAFRLGLERHFYTTSACGVCGKTSLEALAITPATPLPAAAAWPRLDPQIIHGLPQALRAAQRTFDKTGGLHAAGLFNRAGELLLYREDIGRHNAVDKLFGAALLNGRTQHPESMLLVSGRASFELVQKARMAGVPILVAVGAPSSLAVELARESGMTLIGFARDGRYNIYSAPERLALLPAPPHPSR